MKVLVVAQHVNFFRNLDAVMRELSSRGHDVLFLHGAALDDPRAARKFERKADRGKVVLTRGLALAESSIAGVTSGHRPKPPEPWCRALRYGRQVMNRATFLRRNHPSPTRVVDVLERDMPPRLAAALSRTPWKQVLRLRSTMRAWRVIEDVSPPSETLTALLEDIRPQVVIVSPCVWPKDLVEADYIRAARALHIPTIGYVNSWDNLTSKGTSHVLPDRFVVWNEPMAREAEQLHVVPRRVISVTGAPHLDFFFAMRATATHDEACVEMGCPADRPYIVYLCSSRTLIASEVDIVTRLAAALRARIPDRTPTIVVRPHPTNAGPWDDVELPGVVVYPRGGDQSDSPASWQQYFNQLASARCAFGLNTTAFLEAAVAGLPCVTVVSDEFWAAQGRTGHFRHLLDGGFLEVAPDIATAAEQLARIVDGADDRMKKRAAFVASFLRPCGIDRPAAHVVADLIEATARGMETSPRHTRAAEAFAHRAIPRLRRWATRRATGEARERIAAHVALRTEKHGEARSSRLLFMVPDAAATTALLPTLELLSRDRDRSHVAVSRTATDAAEATQLHGLYTGLTIGHAPAMEDIEMRRLSMVDFLEERRPDLLIVARSDDAAVDKEYIDAARSVGVRTVLLNMRWTDFRPAGSALAPAADVITAWNEHQRSRLVDAWQLPAERILVTGALVPSDASGRKVADARAQLCARTGLDASHPIVVFVAPAAASASLLAVFQEWRHLLAAGEEGSASVVVYVERAEQVQLWRRMAADARISVARAGDDQERALVRLDETLSGADVVVAVDMPLVLEAGARGRPLIAWLNAGDTADSELARFADMFAADGWPSVARTAADAARAVVETIAKQRGNPKPFDLVRPSADATGAARLCRLLQHTARGRSGALASDGGEVGVDHRLERLGGVGGR